jgi:outer membrane protein TolC
MKSPSNPSLALCSALALAALSLVPQASRAQEIEGLTVQPGGLTIEDATRRALAASSSLGEKLAELDAANARITQTTVQFVPKLGLRASAMYLSPTSNAFGSGALLGAQNAGQIQVGDCPDGTPGCVLDSMGQPVGAAAMDIEQFSHSYTLGAQLSVLLSDYLLRLSDAADGAESSRKAAKLAVAAVERKVIADTRVLYYNWLRAHAQVFLASKAVERTHARLNDARAAAEVGRLANADVMRIEALVANAEAAAFQTEAMRRTLGAQLAIVMRDQNAPDYAVGSGVPADSGVARDPAGDRGWVAEAMQNRLELKAIDAATDALEHGRDAVASGAWPRLDAVGDVTYANPNQRFFPPQDEFNATWSVGVVASYSFDAPFGASAQSDELAANAAANRARRSGLEGAIVNEVVTAHLDGVRARTSLVAAETSVRAAEEGYRVVTDRFQVGSATTSDVVDAESDLLAAKLAITNARIDLTIAAIKLDYALGRKL